MNDLYQEIILDHFKHPHNMGEFTNENEKVRTVKKVNIGCGDAINVQVLLDEHKEVVQDIRWQGQGCAISIAAMSTLSDAVKGKTVAEISQWNEKEILELLGLDEITVGREKCLLLGLRAIQSVLK